MPASAVPKIDSARPKTTVPNDPSTWVKASRMSTPLPAVFWRSLVMSSTLNEKYVLDFTSGVIGAMRPKFSCAPTQPLRIRDVAILLLSFVAASVVKPVKDPPITAGARGE